jgi:Domain of unknown function (DUF5753)
VNTGERSVRVGNYPGVRDGDEDASPNRERYIGKPVRNGLAPAWWKPFNLPYGDYIALESAALSIRDFDPGVFPGLLQAPDYARALHERADPLLPDELIEQQIETRRIRQEGLLRDNPLALHAIVDEAVLHRVVGSPKVMADQLAHVIKACAQENVTVQVLEYRAGAHPALNSSFILLDFAPPQPSVVYLEDLIGHDYRKEPADVRLYSHVYGTLCGLALSRCASIELMERIRDKYEQE